MGRKALDQFWKTDQRTSTKKAGPLESMNLESNINALTTNPKTVELAGDSLIVKNSDGDMMLVSKWQRYSTQKKPVTQNPFN